MTIVVQLGAIVLINTVGVGAARKTLGEELVRGARVFDRLKEQDTERLVQGARLLSADYAFRDAVSSGDSGTIASVLWNHSKRIDADFMMLVGLDGRVIADTSAMVGASLFHFPAFSIRPSNRNARAR